MIVTVCKSCDTVSRSIIDRCKYCGSQRVEVKNIESEYIGYESSTREVYIVKPRKKIMNE